MVYNEGQWDWRAYGAGADSSLFNKKESLHKKSLNVTDLKLGTVLIPQPEPVYKESSVSVSLVTGGILTNVAWPGCQVDMNPSGVIPGGAAIGIHGLWEAPVSGQQVLVGFVEGHSQNPVVIQKYPYNASARPDLEFLHILPMTLKIIGPTDVALGHYLGSYIALRGTLPVPGEIDILAMSVFNVISLGVMNTTCGGASAETVAGAKVSTIGGAYTLTSGAAVSLTAGAAMALVSGGPLTMAGVPGVNINAGVFPAAAVGDLVATMLGPQPVLPGPGRVPTGLTIT